MTEHFNFKDECIYKYDRDIYKAIMNTFDCLPISATINNKFLACHGGLSPDISVLNDINMIDRFREIPTEGPFCDLM
jgi:serine/threonine-protein phosphatase 2B catalytic subunit